MFFYMPAKAFEESECVSKHSADIAAFGKKALIVTGKSSAVKCGAQKDVTSVLEENDIAWTVFAEVEENPSVETIMKARDKGLAEKVDFVIGIGGGSPMDAAKAIALMLYYAEEDASYMYKSGAESKHLPLVLIPTTCGTGSEVTAVSVLTNHETQKKGSIPHKIFGNLALLDGKYLTGAPMSVLANTTMDALTHLMESYVNTKATDYSRMCAEAGLKIWSRSKDVIEGKREAAPEDYSNMLRASMMAGMAIAHTGTSLPHALSYRLTYSGHIAHGKACGYFLPGYLQEADPETRAHVLALAGFENVAALRNYYEATCGTIALEAGELNKLLEQTAAEVLATPEKLALAPFDTDEKVVRRIAKL